MHIIDQAMLVDRSGSVVLEELLRNHFNTPDHLAAVGLKEIIAVGAWYIWWQRREAVKGETVAPPSRTSFSIHALALNFQEADSRATTREIKWSRPASGTYKLNVDGCFFSNGTGASGAVVRNSRGDTMAGMCGWVP